MLDSDWLASEKKRQNVLCASSLRLSLAFTSSSNSTDMGTQICVEEAVLVCESKIIRLKKNNSTVRDSPAPHSDASCGIP